MRPFWLVTPVGGLASPTHPGFRSALGIYAYSYSSRSLTNWSATTNRRPSFVTIHRLHSLGRRLRGQSSRVTGADLGGGVTRVTSNPPWRSSLFHAIIMRVTYLTGAQISFSRKPRTPQWFPKSPPLKNPRSATESMIFAEICALAA